MAAVNAPDAAANAGTPPAPQGRHRHRVRHPSRGSSRGQAPKPPRGVRRSRIPALAAGATGLLCLALALLLASHYPFAPLGPLLLGAAVLAVAVLARFFWTVWPAWMLGLLPVCSAMPWTGWWLADEFDLLLLASAAGGYFAISGPHRHGAPPPTVSVWRRELRWRGATWVALGLVLLLTVLALVQGLRTLPGTAHGLFQGYHDPGHALRATKSLLGVALLLPLWWRIGRRNPQSLTPALFAGLTTALLLSGLGVVVERSLYTGFTDFSPDAHLSGWFWEMHTGGAALEGALALLLPTALLGSLQLRGPKRFGLAAAALMLGLYAALNTFSRALYLALALSLPLTLALWWWQVQRAQNGQRDPASSWLPGQVLPSAHRPLLPWRNLGGLALLLALALVGAAWMFPVSGYRGLFALVGAVLALLAQPMGSTRAPAERALGTALGAVLALPVGGLAWVLANAVDKAAYGFYALAWLVCVALARAARHGRKPWNSPLGDALRAGSWFSVLACSAVVAWSWGGTAMAERALGPLALLAVAWPLSQGGSFGALLRGLSWRSRLGSAAAMVLGAAGVAALGGGATLATPPADRPLDTLQATLQTELQSRITHWQRSLALVDVEKAWLSGAGAGRFVSLFAQHAPADEAIGDARLVPSQGQTVLELVGGRHALGPRQLLRLAQRIGGAPPELVLRLQHLNEAPVQLQVEVCERHLLDVGACLTQRVTLPTAVEWVPATARLGGAGELPLQAGRSLTFAVAVAGKGESVKLTQLALQGRDGVEQLRNGHWQDGLAHWFITSDRHHQPWQAGSLPLQLYVEQGVLGLGLVSGLVLLVIGRLGFGQGRDHRLAPAVVGGLLGFAVLGLFHGLLDTPRIAFLFYTLLVLGLGLRPPPLLPATAQATTPA